MRDDKETTGEPRYRRRALPPGGTDLFSSEGSFSPPVGSHWAPGQGLRGYYIDFSVKAEAPEWPPKWLGGVGGQFHVAPVQWGLGALERYFKGDGERWRAAAIDAGDYLIGEQIHGGARDGAWLHWVPMPHTYGIDPPWSSAIAQGEAASLLVRLHLETGEERFADAATRALRPMLTPVEAGGALADVNDLPFFEEYPTRPPSLVLNGAIFALWGFHDVAEGLGDSETLAWYESGIQGLSSVLERYDTGYWSRYDLYPHPVANIASSAYHLLHINQLSVLGRLTPRPQFDKIRLRFEGYRESRALRSKALGRKIAFRIMTPRNSLLAHRLPWNRRVRGQSRDQDLVVLCYHAVSDEWNTSLAIRPSQLREQVRSLLDAGYRPSTFTDGVLKPRPHKSFAVTFDDAFASVAEQGKPILDELGVPGTVFVPTGFTDHSGPMAWPGISQWLGGPDEHELRPLSWEDLRALDAAGWEIGSHSRSHARLTELSKENVLAELTLSREECARGIGRPCTSLAFPYGDYNQDVVRIAARAGYTAAATLPPPYSSDSVLAWPRVGIYRVDTQKRFRLKVSRSMRRLRRSRLGPLLMSAARRTSRPGEVPS